MDYEKMSDDMLVELFKNGDESAFEALLSRYEKMVKGLAHTLDFLVGDIEDLWQEGFMGLFFAAEKYDPGKENSSSFKTFAYSCIKNRMLTAVKADNYGQRNVNIDDMVDVIYCETLSPEDMIIDRESRKEIISKITERLSGLEKDVFDMAVRGYKYGEIADALGVPAKSVDNALQRIKDKCKI